VSSKYNKNKKRMKDKTVDTGNKTGATGFATNRTRVNKVARIMSLVLIAVMVVFMLISSSVYLFN